MPKKKKKSRIFPFKQLTSLVKWKCKMKSTECYGLIEHYKVPPTIKLNYSLGPKDSSQYLSKGTEKQRKRKLKWNESQRNTCFERLTSIWPSVGWSVVSTALKKQRVNWKKFWTRQVVIHCKGLLPRLSKSNTGSSPKSSLQGTIWCKIISFLSK